MFVSDGYCNARVAQFTANGSHVGDFVGSLAVPHAVALDECRGHLYVASREAKQVAIFELGSRKELGASLSFACAAHNVLRAPACTR